MDTATAYTLDGAALDAMDDTTLGFLHAITTLAADMAEAANHRHAPRLRGYADELDLELESRRHEAHMVERRQIPLFERPTIYRRLLVADGEAYKGHHVNERV